MKKQSIAKIASLHRIFKVALGASVLTSLIYGATASAATVTTAFGNGADAWVTRGSPTDNFGSDDSLHVGRSSSGSGTDTGLAYLKFDISGITATVDTADLKVSVTDDSGDSGFVRFFVLDDAFSNGSRVEDFDESTITDNTAPAREFPDSTDLFDEDNGSDFDAMTQFASTGVNQGSLAAGEVVTVSGSALTTALNNDTNDILVVGIRGSAFFDDFFFASKENPNIGTGDWISPTLDYTVVPEPSSYTALLGLGTLGFILIRRRAIVIARN